MEILAKVKELNVKANNLNKKREQALWERNKAKADLDKAMAEYKEKYGIELTEDNIESEYNTVLADITAKAEKLANDIKAIENGESIVSNTKGTVESTVSTSVSNESVNKESIRGTATEPVNVPRQTNSQSTSFEEWQAKMLGFESKDEVSDANSDSNFTPQFDFHKYID